MTVRYACKGKVTVNGVAIGEFQEVTVAPFQTEEVYEMDTTDYEGMHFRWCTCCGEVPGDDCEFKEQE